MCTRPTEVEAGYAGLGAAQAGYRPEDQLLVQLRGATVDRSGQQAGIGRLEVAWCLDGAPDDQLTESRSVPFDELLDNVHVGLKAAGVQLESPGHMGIRPGRFRSDSRSPARLKAEPAAVTSTGNDSGHSSGIRRKREKV